jgi:hypothetical protein
MNFLHISCKLIDSFYMVVLGLCYLSAIFHFYFLKNKYRNKFMDETSPLLAVKEHVSMFPFSKLLLITFSSCFVLNCKLIITFFAGCDLLVISYNTF